MLYPVPFDAIKRESSTINILIGSKKFIEGWDTWRVSSMGLLNIGKGQGPQIIQLFGRGVRLKGKGMSLKRSDDTSPVRFLEMLNIYGIKADYLSKFLEAIRKEEVEFETIEIPIKPQHEGKWKTLYTLTKDEKKRFEEEEILQFRVDDSIKLFTVDLLPKVSMYQARERKEEGIQIEQIKAKVQAISFGEDIVGLLDWDRIWEELYDYKTAKEYWNFVFDRQGLKSLLLSDRYEILALPDVFEIRTDDDVRRVEDMAILVIRKYIDLFYRKYAKRFETENLHYATVGKQLTLSLLKSQEMSTVIQCRLIREKKSLS